MSTHTTDDVRDERPASADGTAGAGEIVAKIVGTGDGPVECTLHPADATGMELMTTWITAREGSFVRLEEMR